MSLIRLTIQYQCSRCPMTHTERAEIPIGGHGPDMKLPPGWTMVMGELYCANHEVVIMDVKGRG